MTDTRKPVHVGGCQCGAVRYALYAEPTNPHVCHCRMCQKAVGGYFGAFAGVPLADFAWVAERIILIKHAARVEVTQVLHGEAA